jgi:hypothetical protein
MCNLMASFDVVDSLFVCFALTVATLESGAGNEKTVGVCFDDDWKSDVLHDVAHYRSVMGTGETESAEECDGGRARLMGKVKGPTRQPRVWGTRWGLKSVMSGKFSRLR